MARLPVATTLTVLLSLLVSGPGLLRGGSPLPLSLKPGAVREWQVHRLVTYIFLYKDVIGLVCSAIIVWYFAGSFEKNVGTVKHCFFTVIFAVSSALLYLVLQAVLSGLWEIEDAIGFTPVAFAMFGVTVTRSRMRRTLLFGLSFPVVLVPWFLLGVVWLIPHSPFLGNICGLLIGEVYGHTYCFGLDLHDSTAAQLDRRFPFRLLKIIPGVKYIPGSVAERRASHSRKINPVPGSYPTQSYPSSPPPAWPLVQMHSNIHAPGSWPQHAFNHQHIPALNQAADSLGGSHIQSDLHAAQGVAVAASISSYSQHVGGPDLWLSKKMDCSVGEVCQAARLPTMGAALAPSDLCQVHVG